MGRKGKFEDWLSEDSLTVVEGYARSGMTDEMIAQKIGIGVRTYYEWCDRFPQFQQAIKRGKAPVDVEVENALLKSALGFEYEETITEIIEQPDGTQRKQVKKIKHYAPPSNTAQIFWLKNRRPDRWRDRQELTGNINLAGANEALKEAYEKMKQGLEND